MNTSAASWAICYKPQKAAAVRLFCLPYAGGGASAYRLWANELPDHIEVWAIQLPGREGRMREAPLTHMSLLVTALANVFQTYLDKQFALFGHSLGSLIGFELVRQLRRLYGREPIHFFASGRRAPHILNHEAPIHALPAPQFIAELQHRYNGIPEQILQEPELLELFLPVLRADLTILETYRYAEDLPFSCPITAFCGHNDPNTAYDDLLAWGKHTTSTFEPYVLRGNHFFLQDDRATLLRTLAHKLERTRAPRADPPSVR